MSFHLDNPASEGGGAGTIGGSIASGQVPVGSAVNTIGGSADITFAAANGLAILGPASITIPSTDDSATDGLTPVIIGKGGTVAQARAALDTVASYSILSLYDLTDSFNLISGVAGAALNDVDLEYVFDITYTGTPRSGVMDLYSVNQPNAKLSIYALDSSLRLGPGSTTWDSGIARLGASSIRITDGGAGYGSLTAADFILTDGKSLKSDTTTAHTALIQAYDVDGAAYATFGTLTNGNTPSFALAAPAGGALTIAGAAITTSTYNGNTLTAGSSTYTGTAAQTYTFPTTSATIARTDAGQTFSGENILAHGTITTALSPLTITETRNAAGVTFPGLVYNVTDTASAAGSPYFDVQLASTSKFRLMKATTFIKIQLQGGTANDLLSIGGSAGANIEYSSNALGRHYLLSGDTTGSGGPTVLAFGSGGTITWQSTTRQDSGSADTIIGRGGAAAIVQHGVDVNGAAVSQTLQAANGITGSDRVGGNFEFGSGKGTGAGAESQVTISTPTAVASGTTAQTRTVRVTVNSSGLKATGYLSSDGSAGVTAGPFTTITSITVKNGLVTALTGA